MWRIVFTPVQFFQARLSQAPSRTRQFGPPVAVFGLALIAAFIMGEKTMAILYREVTVAMGGEESQAPTLGWMFTMLGALAAPLQFCFAVVAVLCVDVLTTDSDRKRQLIEFTGLSFLASQTPRYLFNIVAGWVWSPGALRLPYHPSQTDIMTAVRDYRLAVFADPWISTARVIGLSSVAWMAFLLATSLRVVSGLSTMTTFAVAVMLFVLFGGFDLMSVWRG